MCRQYPDSLDLRNLNGMEATLAERLVEPEEARRIHRSLWEAVRSADTASDYREARAAWDAHIEGHKASAARIRAGREK